MRRISFFLYGLLLFSIVNPTIIFSQDDSEDYEEPDENNEDEAEYEEEEKPKSSGLKRFSLGINFGYVNNLGNLNDTISKDGLGLAATGSPVANVANTYYGVTQMAHSDSQNLFASHNSASTGSDLNQTGSVTEGGGLHGFTFGIDAQLDLDDELKFPLFVRTGFNYTFRVAGGKQSRTLGSLYANDPTMLDKLNTAGITSNEYDGGTMSSTYNTSYLQVPFALGINFRFQKVTAYIGIGASYFNGTSSVSLNYDSKYAAALATYPGASAAQTRSLSPGALTENIQFKLSGMAINYFFGAEQRVIDWLGIFIEMNAGQVAKTVLSEKFSSNFSKLVTAASGTTNYDKDPEYFKRTTLPITMGAVSIRMGLRFYLL